MSRADEMIAELTSEAEKTRRLFERLPEEKLGWKPHPKSMTLGQLANHLAVLPTAISSMATEDVHEARTPPLPDPENAAAVLALHERSVREAVERIAKFSDADLAAQWTLTVGGKPVIEVPRGGMLRAILLNHIYHHRGQLALYLRMLDVAVPSTFGPTADENPFKS